jgi:hypothetical protein
MSKRLVSDSSGDGVALEPTRCQELHAMIGRRRRSRL